MKNCVLAVAVTVALLIPTAASSQEPALVSDLKITTLSTMLTELRGTGEWGFAALVEADGRSILFDTGARPNTVLENARELGIDLSMVETVILSHNHWDHTGGLVSLRRTLGEVSPTAMQNAHVGDGIFLPRRVDPEALARIPVKPPKELLVQAVDVRDEYEALGGHFTIHKEPYELHPGIWITGPIPRGHDEKNWTPLNIVERNGAWVEDSIPEDQALVINTSDGLVVVAGCGHAGIVNTMEYAQTIAGGRPVHAVIGGFHMLSLTDEEVAWTGSKMRAMGVEQVIGAHCTGINAVAGLRDAGQLSRQTAVVGAVGSTYTSGEGIKPGFLTR